MTRQWPSNRTTPRRLAACLLALGSTLGCGLNKAPVAEQEPAASTAATPCEPIQTVGFISAAQLAKRAAEPCRPSVEPESLDLLPLPPVEDLMVRGGKAIPLERAEEVFGEKSRPEPLPPLEPTDAALANGWDRYGGNLSEIHAHPLAKLRADETLVDLAAAIPVFSTIDPTPFEVADEDEHRALAPPRVSPPSPAQAASVPVLNLADAVRGERRLAGETDPVAPSRTTTGDQAATNSSSDLTNLPNAKAAAATSRATTPERYGSATLLPEPEQSCVRGSEEANGEVGLAEAGLAPNGTAAREPENDERQTEAEVTARDVVSSEPADSDVRATPPGDAWQSPTTPTPTNPLTAGKDHTHGTIDGVAAGKTLHPVATGVPTGAKINQLAVDKIRRGYSLAQRGAYYSAQSEFVAVLRMLAQGKDHLTGQPRRSRALSAGLRALDEVRDLAPTGGALDADVDLSVITSSHRTPVAETSDEMLPQQLMDVYFRYAQIQLGAAVAGEPAGSMALHALGKLYSQLGRVEAEQHPLATRFAYTYQQAALLAHNQNHLAAHELGVLMAQSGHYQEAEDLLQQVAAREPHPQVLQNLARVQQQLGHIRLAAETKTTASQMRTRYGSANGITWVDPTVFSSQSRPNWQESPMPRVAERPR